MVDYRKRNELVVGLGFKNYQQYLKSRHWWSLRYEVYKERDHRCERCGREKNLQVHHIIYDHIGKEPLEDLEIICSGCHKRHHKNERYLRKLPGGRRAAKKAKRMADAVAYNNKEIEDNRLRREAQAVYRTT